MKVRQKSWVLFLSLAFLSIIIWFQFSYPQFSFLDLSIDRRQAVNIAKDYLSKNTGLDPSEFRKAVVCMSDEKADRYFQKTLGFKGENEFIDEHKISLFMWIVRFFKENEKEEIHIAVSASTGEVISFQHAIDEAEYRMFREESKSKKLAVEFLQKKFNFNINDYSLKENTSEKYDNRTEYTFEWQKKGVYIPWSEEPDSGGAKLLTSITISGDEILYFSKNFIEIPEQFSRKIEYQKSVGRNLSTAFAIGYIGLLMVAAFLVIVRKHHIMMHVTKKFFIMLAITIFTMHLLAFANKWQSILFGYETTMSFFSYLWQYAAGLVMTAIFIAIATIMPGLAGESLHYENFPKNREKTLLHYINSTFFSRKIIPLVILGYITAIIMLGIQSATFKFGREYLGVWTEQTWVTKISTAYFPFITAFAVALKASAVEEITFRVFSISLGKKIFKSTIIAVIIASVIWGYGHSEYLIFPMWFRGIEVGILGIFLSLIFLKYGIIPVLVAHYVFDAFWVASGHLLGKSQPFHTYSSLFVLLLPLFLGIIAFIINKPEKERPMEWKLSPHQIYNLKVLKSFLDDKNIKDYQNTEQIKKELISHGWDIVVVEKAIKEYFNNLR